MGRLGQRYDSEWEEVKLINGYAMLLAYTLFAIRGIGFLVFTWSTVVLLGGFVSMIDKVDFGRLTLITLIQILWIEPSFIERFDPYGAQSSSLTMKNLLTSNSQLADAVVNRVVAVVLLVLSLVQSTVLIMCIASAPFFLFLGMLITAWISVRGLMDHDHYGDTDEGRVNMDPVHNVLYTMCVAQSALWLCRIMLLFLEERVVKQVSQAYGFQDGDRAVLGYLGEVSKGCFKNISSARERNLITYAVELMESKSPHSYLSGALILDRLLTRQHSPILIKQEEEKQQQQLDLEEKTGAPLVQKDTKKKEGNEESNKKSVEIIVQQRRMIKRLIGSASSIGILHRLLQTLDSQCSSDRKVREAAARIVEHVAGRIHLEKFPQGIQCVSSLINTFEEYRRLQPYRSLPSSSNRKEATVMTLAPSPNTKNCQEQEQGRSSINTLSFESNPEYLESDSESDSDSDMDKLSFSELVAMGHNNLKFSIMYCRQKISKSSNTATAISSSSKSKSDNGIDRPSSSKANRSTTNQFHGYKELLLTGLHILWKLAGSEDNCTVISNTKHLVSKIMAPVIYDIVHHAGHSAWSTQVVERSLGVILRLIVNTKGDTGADLRQQISSDKGSIGTMKKIVVCEECKGEELQMKAMQILTHLCIDETANRGNLTKVLVRIFINGDSSNTSIRKTAGETLVLLFLSSKSVATLLPKEEHNEFIGGLAKILLQVGDNDTCRKNAAEILEHLCIQFAENGEYLSTLKNTITCVMPEVLREICHGSTGEEEKPEYARSDTDIESQSETKKKRNKKKNASSSPGQNEQHKLYVALLSLCVTACEKLHLDLNAISLGQAMDPGECVAFSLATKMVQLNRDLITADSLTAMKLTTRMVIAAMKKLEGNGTTVDRANLESLIDSLSSVSETMLDLEGCIVFAMTKPATVDTLHSLVKQARQLHAKIQDQDLEIVAAS
ncbi:hypothetical protein CFC21_000317 [Triticum aestivum]|uniref:Uncharacterized protein n=1 Tax=Triticum aestivum TaxID=4565 RepID=A0A3B5XTU8_WHEAT|nr:uncharacterized protein LOC123071436 [Triticum aestivum]KAF6981869.1 hypothetical protein CFC21_000317 [Triticum aestivum]